MSTWIARALLASTAIAVLVLQASAADLIEPQPVLPPPTVVDTQPFGGWYLRGDVGYRPPGPGGSISPTFPAPGRAASVSAIR